ncbi:MAG: zinc-binding alcohol dehydrogenase [Filomicrobium sp.]
MTDLDPTGVSSKKRTARALWYVEPGSVALRTETLPDLNANSVLLRTSYSGISRGTERLVCSGSVPESEFERMQAPMQSGEFPFPVKYGYCTTAIAEDGPKDLIGKAFFCLHPHQDLFVAPTDAIATIPTNIPAKRATLAANMETALNAHWDAASSPCDRVAVIGAGIVGLLVAYIASRIPGTEVLVIDTNPARQRIAESFGAHFSTPDDVPDDRDIVFHASATSAGLATALNCAGQEARVVELSWYGTKPVAAPLGEAFHARRINLISSQVGQVAATHRARWNYRKRLTAAISLLDWDGLDALVDEEIAFEDAPELLPKILDSGSTSLAPVIRYP